MSSYHIMCGIALLFVEMEAIEGYHLNLFSCMFCNQKLVDHQVLIWATNFFNLVVRLDHHVA